MGGGTRPPRSCATPSRDGVSLDGEAADAAGGSADSCALNDEPDGPSSAERPALEDALDAAGSREISDAVGAGGGDAVRPGGDASGRGDMPGGGAGGGGGQAGGPASTEDADGSATGGARSEGRSNAGSARPRGDGPKDDGDDRPADADGGGTDNADGDGPAAGGNRPADADGDGPDNADGDGPEGDDRPADADCGGPDNADGGDRPADADGGGPDKADGDGPEGDDRPADADGDGPDKADGDGPEGDDRPADADCGGPDNADGDGPAAGGDRPADADGGPDKADGDGPAAGGDRPARRGGAPPGDGGAPSEEYPGDKGSGEDRAPTSLMTWLIRFSTFSAGDGSNADGSSGADAADIFTPEGVIAGARSTMDGTSLVTARDAGDSAVGSGPTVEGTSCCSFRLNRVCASDAFDDKPTANSVCTSDAASSPSLKLALSPTSNSGASLESEPRGCFGRLTSAKPTRKELFRLLRFAI